ncbi:putative AAA-ATPase domain-containing protein [Ditylenchus destructor]|uniref:AAA-ATPase domain-containing protein n=1 Tax=Ditylenchus destructor TaxID=166010 RepID=A0AAD4QUT0_9BILA|nr:putative AAA-ATPase domain-containing protein [Ditylenchus destructor]
MSGNSDDLDSTLVPSANERFIQTIPLKEFSDSNDDYCVYFITTLPGCGKYVLEQGASSDQNTVIHLDMKDLAAGNLRTLVRTLLKMVECAIGKHGRQLPDFGQSNVTSALESLLTSKFSSAEERVEYYIDSVVVAYTAFKKLLRSLKEECGTKFMLLIQNYDSPITDILSKVNNEQDASQLYDQYCDFIRRVASNSECIKCVVMTGRLLFQIKDFPDPDELGGPHTYISFKKHKFNRYFAMTQDQFSEECQKLSVSDGIKRALMGAYSVKIDNDVYLRTAPTISFLERFRKNENADVLESNHFIEHSFLVTLQSHFHDGDLYNLLSKVVKRFEKGEPFLPFEKFSPINEFNPEVFLTFSNMLELRNLSKRGLNMPQESLHDFVRYLCHLSLLWPQKQDNAWSIGIPNVQSYSTLKYEREKALGLLSKIPKIRLLHLTELFKGTDDTSHLKELCTCFAQRVYEGSTSGSSAHSSGSSTPSGSTKSRPNKRKLGSTGDSASPSTMERYFSKEYARCDENSNFTRDYTRDFDSFQSDSYPDQVAGKFDNSTSDDMMEEDD